MRKKEAINMQVNASLTALNLLKIEDRTEKLTSKPTEISIASWKRRKFNQHLMDRLFDALGLERSCKKSHSFMSSMAITALLHHKTVRTIVTTRDFAFSEVLEIR